MSEESTGFWCARHLIADLFSNHCASATVVVVVMPWCALKPQTDLALYQLQIRLPVLMENDIHDVKNFACKNYMDFIAASFVQSAEDVRFIRQVRGCTL